MGSLIFTVTDVILNDDVTVSFRNRESMTVTVHNHRENSLRGDHYPPPPTRTALQTRSCSKHTVHRNKEALSLRLSTILR